MAGPPAVGRVLERITATARRHEMFEPGQRIVVACSGGPDSVCLLHALHRLRRLFRIRLVVFHFDHRLRSDSSRDTAYVRGQASKLGLPFTHREADSGPKPGESVEAWARLARYAALSQVVLDSDAQSAALAHTLDDQAETVLLGLVRGGGIEAVSGMPAVGAVPPLGVRCVRPAIETTRAEVEAFNRSLRLRPREDPMNREPRFLRNRVRHEILPVLEGRLDRNVRATLARTAENVRSDAEYLELVASESAIQIVGVVGEEVRIDAAGLAALPPPIGIRVARQALRLAGALSGEWDPDVSSTHLRGVLDLAAGRPGRRIDLPVGLMAVRSREYVRVPRVSAAPSPGLRRAAKNPRGSRREAGDGDGTPARGVGRRFDPPG